jgi:hypothetical protein
VEKIVWTNEQAAGQLAFFHLPPPFWLGLPIYVCLTPTCECKIGLHAINNKVCGFVVALLFVLKTHWPNNNNTHAEWEFISFLSLPLLLL